MVLEELKQSDALPLNNLFDLLHEGLEFLGAVEVDEFGLVGRLGAGVRSVNYVN